MGTIRGRGTMHAMGSMGPDNELLLQLLQLAILSLELVLTLRGLS
ncbi:hypothetical protein GCM10027203_18080 [Nonomuraea fastidiosa]